MALSLDIPIFLAYDNRIKLDFKEKENEIVIKFLNDPDFEEIPISKNNFIERIPYISGDDFREEQLEHGLERLQSTLRDRPNPAETYAYLITRLKKDFSQVREAIESAVTESAGIPLIWIDKVGYDTNISGVRLRTKELIKNAAFVVADISSYPENPHCISASRAHEIGLADKSIFISSQTPRRSLYYSITDYQVHFWYPEDDLYRQLNNWIYEKRENLSRRIYNRELTKR